MMSIVAFGDMTKNTAKGRKNMLIKEFIAVIGKMTIQMDLV
jgi:hypothetical protein